jgi:phosphatidylglycerol:prolipoprotein diacylglycerol transferase
MFPVLFRLPNGFELRTYGLLLVLGVLAAIWLGRRRAPAFGVQPERVWDCAPWLVIPGVLGARVVYIAQHWDYYSAHPAELWSLRFEGLTSFGGLVGGFLGFVVWRRIAKVETWRFLDLVSVPVLVAQAVGRVGCLLNGCCYGRPSNHWCAVPVAGHVEPHLPAQLLDSALLVLGAIVLARLERPAPPYGASFGWMLAIFGASRFVYEFLRAGTQAEFDSGVASSVIGAAGLTNAQWVSLAMVVGGVAIALARRARHAAEGSPA